MKKFLRRFTFLLFTGIVVFTLVSACSQSNYQKSISSKQSAEECRMVQHVLGKTCVAKNPQRLVTISPTTLANVLALGIKPIGSTTAFEFPNSFPKYFKNRIEGVEILGRLYQASIEKVVYLKPDLILGVAPVKTIYPLLSQIAPTALGKWESSPSWREHFNFVAEVLGKKAAAKEVWNHYYQRIKQLKTALNNRYKDQKISVITVNTSGEIYASSKDSFIGSILDDLGLQRPKSQNVNSLYGVISGISEETLREVDGDILFIQTTATTDNQKKMLETLRQKPLWQTLKAVQQDKVYYVDTSVWTGSNLLAADAVIDDLFKILVNTP